MTEIHQARRELNEAWAASPFSYERVAKAMAVLLELCDYDPVKFAFLGRAHLAVNNTCLIEKKKG